MSRNKQPENVFLTLGLRNSDSQSNLEVVEIIGIPGQKDRHGECVISATTEKFFDHVIAKPVFRSSNSLKTCNFSYLKVWLYDTTIEDQGYQIPEIDDRSDLEIEGNVPFSKLKYIYVLNNGYKGNEYRQWKKDVEALVSPLFKSFLAPPAPSPSLAFNPFAHFLDSIDGYAKMKNEVFFNALIIQID